MTSPCYSLSIKSNVVLFTVSIVYEGIENLLCGHCFLLHYRQVFDEGGREGCSSALLSCFFFFIIADLVCVFIVVDSLRFYPDGLLATRPCENLHLFCWSFVFSHLCTVVIIMDSYCAYCATLPSHRFGLVQTWIWTNYKL